MHQTIALQHTQRLRQHLGGDALQFSRQFAMTKTPGIQRADNQIDPFAGQHLQHGMRHAFAPEHIIGDRERVFAFFIHGVPIYQKGTYWTIDSHYPNDSVIDIKESPMRIITQTTVGDPDVLVLTEAPVPQPKTGEVLVRVQAAGINPVDLAVRGGFYPLLGQPPFTIGWDISGAVEALGDDVEGLAVGDEVFGMPRFPKQAAAYAEYVVAPASEIALKPQRTSHDEAGALPLAGLTAWQGLVDKAGVKPGDRVLIHAGAGGVGHLAVQIAKARGAYVIATTSASKLDFVKSLGADEVIDRTGQDFVEQVKKADIVLDPIGGEHVEQSLKVLDASGTLIALLDPSEKARSDAKAAGIRLERISVTPDGKALTELARLVEAGKLKVEVAKSFSLEQAGAAHAFLTTRPAGKVVLTV